MSFATFLAGEWDQNGGVLVDPMVFHSMCQKRFIRNMLQIKCFFHRCFPMHLKKKCFPEHPFETGMVVWMIPIQEGSTVSK